MALNSPRNGPKQNVDVDPNRYERICARCGVANPFVNRTCLQCGAHMAGAPPVLVTPDSTSPRSPSQLGGAPHFRSDEAADLSVTVSAGAIDDEARWETYWQRASGQTSAQTSAPTPTASTARAPLPIPGSGRDLVDYDYADIAPGAQQRALRRSVVSIGNSWLGVCVLTVILGTATIGVALWKDRHDRQIVQEQKAAQQRLAHRQSLHRRWAKHLAHADKVAALRRPGSKSSRRGRAVPTRLVQTRSALPKLDGIKTQKTQAPSWATRWSWITNFWRGFQSGGRDAGQVRPVYTKAVRDWDRRHDRRRLEIDNN